MHKKIIALLLSILITTIPFAVAQQTELPVQDTQAPEVQYFSIFPEITSLQPTQFSYQAIDYGQGKDTSICSGVQKVEFFEKENGRVLTTRTGEREECFLEESFEYTPTADGTFNVCARATDFLGKQSEEQCAELTVVTHAPDVKKIEFFDVIGTFTHIEKTGKTLSMKLYFDNTDVLELSQTLINVEKLTGIPSDWRNALLSEDDTITVPDINVKTPFECKIITTIVDIFGNKATKDIQCNLAVDDAAPQTTEIITDIKDIEGAYLISTKEPSVITARIDEKGSGFERNKNVHLDLTAIIKNNKVQTDECHKVNDAWECTWKVVATVPKGGYTITLLDSSTDDAGNSVTSEFKQDVDVTDSTIEILDVQYAPANPTTNDQLTIMVSLPAIISNPLVEIDASKISLTQTPTPTQCEKDGTALRCTARIKNLKQTEGLQPIIITAKEDKGDTKQITQPIEIFAIEDLKEELFNFGGAHIQPLRGIDRKTATVAEYPLAVSITWTHKKQHQDLSIVSQNINCEDKYLAKTPDLVGQQSKRPTLFLTMSTDVSDLKDQTLKIPCTATLIIRKTNTIYKQPQKIPFTLKIPLYNNPLGEVDDVVQKKLDAIKAEIKHLDNRINKWEKTNSVLGKITGIAKIIAQADAIMSMIVTILWVLALVFPNPYTITYWVLGCNLFYEFYLLSKIIWTPAYPTFYSPFKPLAIYYSCQLCQHSGSLSIPFLGGISNIVTKIDQHEGKPTTAESTTLYGWQPYKSIHVAQNCYCGQAIEYNLRKEQQIQCIYHSCIEEHTKKGLPLTACDQTYKTQNCLYVDSAAWKIAGGSRLASLIRQMTGNLMNSLGIAVSGIAWAVACDPLVWSVRYLAGCDSIPATNPVISGSVPACAVWGGTHELAETDFFAGNAFNWNEYNGGIDGYDYCGALL